MKSILSSKSVFTAASIALVALFAPEQSQALQLTYELRVDPATTTPGVVIQDIHTAIATQPGQVIGLQIYAVIHGAEAVPSPLNDGFTQAHLSLISGTYNGFVANTSTGGSLVGNFRGDPATSPLVASNATKTNNAPGFRGLVAQSGYNGNGTVSSLDTPADTGLDIGSFETGGPLVLPWFIAVSDNNTSPTLGTAANLNAVGDTEFLIGTTTFTLALNSTLGQSTPLSIVPRNRTNGGVNGPLVHKFRLDGTDFTLAGNSPQIAEIGVNLSLAPEPSAIGMVLLGAMGLVGFRRSGLRR